MHKTADPNPLFPGVILILAPHMDDEALACGGLVALLERKEHVHIAYATDGMRSPAPIFPGRDRITPDLGRLRMQESIEAMQILKVPAENLHFWALPEARLGSQRTTMTALLRELIGRVQPDVIFVPFRYDRHPDHIALNHVTVDILKPLAQPARLVEYFVYHRWRLLPGGDIRRYVRPSCLVELDTRAAAGQKRQALACFRSQTTLFYPWQTRPILTPQLLDEESQTPEYFLLHDWSLPGAVVFTRAAAWIRVAHRLEPFLQKTKYLAGAYLKRALARKDHHA